MYEDQYNTCELLTNVHVYIHMYNLVATHFIMEVCWFNISVLTIIFHAIKQIHVIFLMAVNAPKK